MTVTDGGLVFDPMAGSGTSGAVAQDRGFRAILCDKSHEYTELIEKRLVVRRLPVDQEIAELLPT